MEDSTHSTLDSSTTSQAHSIACERDFSKVYPMNKEFSQWRFERISKFFKEQFGVPVSHLVRVPAQLKVPSSQITQVSFRSAIMNLEADIIVAVSNDPSKKSFRLHNVEKTKFPPVT